MEYCQEGSASSAIPTTSTSDIMGQHNKTGGIIFGSALTEASFAETLSPSPYSLLRASLPKWCQEYSQSYSKHSMLSVAQYAWEANHDLLGSYNSFAARMMYSVAFRDP